jgi:hypothetical protein
MKFRRGKLVGCETRIKRGRSQNGEGKSHSNGGREVPKLRGRTIPGTGVDFSLKENLTDCVNDSEQQEEGIKVEFEEEYEFEYCLL